MQPQSHNMGPLTLEKAIDNPHYLYDLSIENMEERKEKRQRFDTVKKLAAFIGVPPDEIYDKRTVGRKIFGPRHQRWYAVRIAH